MAVKRFMMPTDYTGELTSNRVLGEVHELGNTQFKLVVPLSGFFYTHNLKVYDDKMKPLDVGTHFQTIYANEEVQMRTKGLEVCGAMVFKPNVDTKTVSISYNQVGGPYANYTAAIEAALIALDLDGREIDFANLKGLPEYFTAGPHAEDIGNVFGFEYVKHGIERLRETLERSGKTTSEQVGSLLNDLIDSINLMFTEHASDSKAHKTTAADVGAYSKLESDAAAQAFRQEIETLREELQTIVDSQGNVGDDLATVQTKLRLLSRRVTVVANVAMNAIKRAGGTVVVSGESSGGGGGVTMAQVREVVKEVDDKLKLPNMSYIFKANTTLPAAGLYYKRVHFMSAGTLTLTADWPEGSHLLVEADHTLTIPGAKCIIASPSKFALPTGQYDSVELVAKGVPVWFTKINGMWRSSLAYTPSGGGSTPGWVDDESYWTTETTHVVTAKAYARKVDISLHQTLIPTGPEQDNRNGPTATVVCTRGGSTVWTQSIPALSTGTYDPFDPSIKAGYGQPTIDLSAGQTLTITWSIGTNTSGVQYKAETLVSTKKAAP